MRKKSSLIRRTGKSPAIVGGQTEIWQLWVGKKKYGISRRPITNPLSVDRREKMRLQLVADMVGGNPDTVGG